jgi:4-hydroxybenzoate polyprenyltransferase
VTPLALPSTKAYLELCRVSNLPTVWTNVLAALLLTEGAFCRQQYTTLALALSLFYSGGMCLNDLCDAETDRLKRPSRPLPSGRVSPRGAWFLTALLFTTGLSLLATLPHPLALPAGIVLLLLIIAYDTLHDLLQLGIVLMAGCRLMLFVVTALGISGGVGRGLLFAGTLQFGYVLLISGIARHEKKRDKPYGMPVIPVMLAGISLLDGVVLALLVSPVWLVAGICGTLMTLAGQKFVRGD